MKTEVTREGVCAADDQIGPLEKTINIRSDATVLELVRKVEESKFLQFSSTHTSMVGYVGNQPIVRVFSPHHLGRQAEFLVDKELAAHEVISNGALSFKF